MSEVLALVLLEEVARAGDCGVLGLGRQARKRYDGQVWANFYLGFFGSSFVLEFVRGYRLPVNMVLEACVLAVTAVIVTRERGSSSVS